MKLILTTSSSGHVCIAPQKRGGNEQGGIMAITSGAKSQTCVVDRRACASHAIIAARGPAPPAG